MLVAARFDGEPSKPCVSRGVGAWPGASGDPTPVFCLEAWFWEDVGFAILRHFGDIAALANATWGQVRECDKVRGADGANSDVSSEEGVTVCVLVAYVSS